LKTGHTSFFCYEISYEYPHKHCIIRAMLCIGVAPASRRPDCGLESPRKFEAGLFPYGSVCTKGKNWRSEEKA